MRLKTTIDVDINNDSTSASKLAANNLDEGAKTDMGAAIMVNGYRRLTKVEDFIAIIKPGCGGQSLEKQFLAGSHFVFDRHVSRRTRPRSGTD